MRKLFFLGVMFAFGAGCAFGQSGLIGGVMNAQPQMFTMPEHPQHAFQAGLAQEQDLREHSESIWAHGERPLWEVMPAPKFVSLGEIARAYREEHAIAPKASIVWKN
ncbi:MAG TPA: hypothetical protein VFA90_20770 [Terriglobales bacterium]|nr:hypothetical protein [Terriglobales bacterium]